MYVTRLRTCSEHTSKCIRDTLRHPRTPINPYKRKFSVQNYQFAYQRKRRQRISSSSLPILGHYTFTTSSILQEPSSSSSESGAHVPWPKTSNPTPYEIFNLPRNASQKEIKSRYFLLVKQYHPDHAPQTSVDRFRKVVESYKILSNPPKRQEYDAQHPATETRGHSEFRRPWSGSRLSRRKTEQKGPPPSGRWSFSHPSRARPFINPDYSQFKPSDVDNAHFNYESHYKRNLEQEMKIKKRMDELHAHRLEFERQREENKQSIRMGFAFTGGLFVFIVLVARAMVPS